jgi:glycerate 2-kinase
MAARWSSILNRENLTRQGLAPLRRAAIDIVEHGIRAADPYRATLDLLELEGDLLRVGPLEYDLGQRDHVYVVGAGKATQPIAQALEEVLGERISGGLIVLKRGEEHRLQRIEILDAAHPIPDQASYEAAQEIVRIARGAGSHDLVIAAVTGGSSALLVWPPEGVSLSAKQAMNELLLNCGASIREINAVRKHVSRIKGGRLALEIFPSELLNITVSDVVGNPVDYITDLTVPDTSTFMDAWRTLDKYELWSRMPGSIRDYLRRGEEIETPKSFAYSYHTFIAVPSAAACLGAARRSEELGFATRVLTTEMEGESREQAVSFVDFSQRLIAQNKAGIPSAVIASGETTVTIDGERGLGGPSQEFALEGALTIAGLANRVIASVASDGTDGPTEASGGLVDGETVSRASAAGLDAADCLRRHSALHVLELTGDLVITGPTGTNVNDLIVFLGTGS